VRPPRLLFSAKRWILSAAFEPGGSRIAVGEEGRGSVLELNDGTTGSVAARVELEATAADQVTNISWSRDRKLLVAVQQFYDPLSPSLPVLWDAESKKQIRPIWPTDPGAFSVTAAVFNPASDELLTVHEGRIAVWDALGLSNYREIRLKVPVFGEEYSIVEVSPNGKWIAAANLNANKIDLYKREDLQSGPRPLEAHTGGIRSLQFSHDSKWLLTASRDRTSLIWSVDSSAPPKVLRGGHTAVLSWASFDADAKRVVTASADRTIRVWDTETLKELAVLRWHGEGVNEVHFSPDGRRILTASDDGTVKLGQCEACNLTVGQLRDRLEELANLSDDELRQVRSEIDATRYFKLPAFLSRAR